MKIVVLSGSPHEHGTSATLVDEFIKGATEAGHDILRFDAASEVVYPCMACEYCHQGDGTCTFEDDMAALKPALIEADAIVFATPIYYYNICAQLKTVVDRFYAFNNELMGGKTALLITTMEDDLMESADAANLWFTNMIKYLKWKKGGILNAMQCAVPEDLDDTGYPERAFDLGKHLEA